MPEISSGLRRILANPVVYRTWRGIIGAHAASAEYVERYLRLGQGFRVLDIGCGPAAILEYLPENVTYIGFDLSQPYIEAARQRYGDRGTFLQASVDEPPPIEPESFDVVSATGLLHHLSDEQVLATMDLAFGSLKPGGRFTTVDPPIEAEGQSHLARWMIGRDRGQNIRTAEQYLALARTVFALVRGNVLHGRLRIPYTHFIMECTKT